MMEYIILALIAYIVLQDYFNRKERKRLIEAFLAKNLTELKQSEIKPAKEIKEIPDFTAVSDLDNEEFDKAIKKQLGREGIIEKAKESLKKVIHGR